MRNLLIAIAALAMAALVTVPKLHRMLQITGRIDGAIHETQTITQKWLDRSGDHGPVYWISWGDAPIRQRGAHRTNVTAERWNRIHIGDKVEFVRVPGDDTRYSRDDDIYTSPGNFLFDFVLLAVELSVAVVMTTKFIGGIARRSRVA